MSMVSTMAFADLLTLTHRDQVTPFGGIELGEIAGYYSYNINNDKVFIRLLTKNHKRKSIGYQHVENVWVD